MSELIKTVFKPMVTTIGQMPQFTGNEIKDEPMLFGCDMEGIQRFGGAITKTFIDKVGESEFLHHIPDGLNWVFDSRSTMTMKGMYPSIPGWHCDDFNRSSKYGQPMLEGRDKRIIHTMVIMGEGDGVSRTQFLNVPETTFYLDHANVWHSLDSLMNETFDDSYCRSLRNGEVIMFNQDAIHRAVEATNPGWRWFGRLSKTYRKPVNEIRKQVQVYVGRNGW